MKRPSSRKRRGAALIVARLVLALFPGFVAVWLSAAPRQNGGSYAFRSNACRRCCSPKRDWNERNCATGR